VTRTSNCQLASSEGLSHVQLGVTELASRDLPC
jgi:hypothetical protein